MMSGAPSAGNDSAGEENETPTAEDLNAMTVAGLKSYAADNGIKLTATRKADIVNEILENQ